MTINFILKDPTASVRTRNALNRLAQNAIDSIVARVKTAVAPVVLSLTTGVHDNTVTVTGANVGDIVIVSPVSLPHSSVGSWVGVVSSADTVTIRTSIVSGPGGA